MGSSAKQSIADIVLSGTVPSFPLTITNAYGGATTGKMTVSPYDTVSLLITVSPGALTTLSMRFKVSDCIKMATNADGEGVVEEIAHAIADGDSFCYSFDTQAIHELEVEFKGDVAEGTITAIEIIATGSDNNTPTIS